MGTRETAYQSLRGLIAGELDDDIADDLSGEQEAFVGGPAPSLTILDDAMDVDSADSSGIPGIPGDVHPTVSQVRDRLVDVSKRVAEGTAKEYQL